MVTYSSTGTRKRFREMIAAHGGGHGRGLPFAPIRNSSELRGLCCRSCFEPRTCGKSIAISSKRFGALNQGFPFSLLQCRQGRTRMGGWEAQRKCVHAGGAGPSNLTRFHPTFSAFSRPFAAKFFFPVFFSFRLFLLQKLF